MIKILSVKTYSVRELITRLHQVQMLKDRSVQPYKTASITVRAVSADTLAPAQRYVLSSELTKVINLRWALAEATKTPGSNGIDVLQLAGCRPGEPVFSLNKADQRINGGRYRSDDELDTAVGFVEMVISTTEGDQVITLLPPIIERQYEGNAEGYNLICDGMHRSFLALQTHRPLNVVYIENSSVDYYAHTLPGGWRDVQLVDSIPAGFIKKFHRFPEHHKYYRDFNSVFSNVGGPRGHG